MVGEAGWTEMKRGLQFSTYRVAASPPARESHPEGFYRAKKNLSELETMKPSSRYCFLAAASLLAVAMTAAGCVQTPVTPTPTQTLEAPITTDISAEAKKPTFDALRSQMKSTETVAIYIHGSGWILNSAEYPMASLFAQALSLTVYSVDSRLVTKHPYPAPLDDCYAVYEGMWHVFEGSTVPKAAVARQDIATFLLEHLGEDVRA
jgi:hypothetical protein